MSLPKILTVFVVAVLVIAGVVYIAADRPSQTSTEIDENKIVDDPDGGQDGDMGSPNNQAVPPQNSQTENPPLEVSFSGEVLAGTVSPVINFNSDDYQKALSGKKLIVLYFYANWCPICREEVPKMYAAFTELNIPAVVAFRVNFNDSDTDNNEEDLAREFGIAYQHTKVILKNGERILKSPETWDKNRYLFEINNALKN